MTANAITGKIIEVVEFDLDYYRPTWFEAVSDNGDVPGWTVDATNTTILGSANANFPSGMTLEMVKASGGGNPGLVAWTAAEEIEDVSVVALMMTVTSGGEFGVVVRGSTFYNNFYAVTLEGGTDLTISKVVGGTRTELESTPWSYTANEQIWIQADAITQVGSTGTVTGVFIRVKAWRGDISDVPDTFTIFYEDESSPLVEPGFAGLYVPNAITTSYCGFFRERSIFSSLITTHRHGNPAGYVSRDFNIVPDLVQVDYTPATISLGEDLGTRAQVVAQFSDHLSADYGEFYRSGTQWGKFRGRQLFRRGQPFRLMHGLVGMDLEDFYTRYMYTESFDGPSFDDKFSIMAQDILKFADNDRAQAPRANSGFLSAELTAIATTCDLLPEGIGDSEYGTQGYVNIGGEEIALFSRDGGIDAYTMLMMQFDGADGSTTMTDTSGRGHNGTANGNAQLDTAVFKFGTASLLLDGVGDFVSFTSHADFVFGNSNFTIDCFFRIAATGAIRFIYDARPLGVDGPYPTLYISSSNFLIWHANGATQILGDTALTTGVMYYVRVARHNGVTRLFLNGVQEGDDYQDSNNYSNGTGRPYIGLSGFDAVSGPYTGWIDCFRLSKGIARTFESPWVVPQAIFSSGSGDMLSLERGQYGTTAEVHEAEDRVQQCLEFVSKSPDYIISHLLEDYASIDQDVIPIYAWAVEIEANLNRLYGRLIAEPTGVNKLVSELIEQAGLVVWWDNVEQLIQLQVLRGIPTSAFEYNEVNTIKGTMEVSEQPQKRLTEVWTYYGVRNPLDPLDQENNYRSQYVLTDLEAATLNGGALIKKVWGTWIPAFAQSTAQRSNQLQLGRFVVAPRKVQFAVPRYTGIEQPTEAGGYQFEYHGGQDELGERQLIPIQVTRLEVQEDRLVVEAEEMRFTTFDPDDLTNRVITIDSNINNINLYNLHNSIFAPVTDQDVLDGVNLTVIVNPGVIVGSANTSLPAFDVDTNWVANFPITLRVLGRIQGCGGAGGGAGVAGSQYANVGLPGGTALYTRYDIVLDFQGASGEVWGGGGGGGAGGGPAAGGINGHGGGGGQGQQPGAGGAIENMPTGEAGEAGTTETPGARFNGGGAWNSGEGGGPGEAGEQGILNLFFALVIAGGAAGTAIDGLSFVTVTSGPGDIQGPQVN